MTQALPEIRHLDEIEPAPLFDFSQKTVFSPKERGEAVLRACGREYHMTAGTALRLPPGVVHEVEVLSDEWVVVAAYCDECQLCVPLHGGKA